MLQIIHHHPLNQWIVEGSPRDSLKESFGCCDYIIVLDEYTVVRLIRVFTRWINQRNGKELYNSKPTLKFLWYNFKWVFEFNRIKKELFDELSNYGRKLKYLDTLRMPTYMLCKMSTLIRQRDKACIPLSNEGI